MGKAGKIPKESTPHTLPVTNSTCVIPAQRAWTYLAISPIPTRSQRFLILPHPPLPHFTRPGKACNVSVSQCKIWLWSLCLARVKAGVLPHVQVFWRRTGPDSDVGHMSRCRRWVSLGRVESTLCHKEGFEVPVVIASWRRWSSC